MCLPIHIVRNVNTKQFKVLSIPGYSVGFWKHVDVIINNILYTDYVEQYLQ